MFDPVSVAGTAGLTEGIKFLYIQLGELLHQRRGRRRESAVDAGAVTVRSIAADGVLAGPMPEVSVAARDLDHAAPTVAILHDALANYVNGLNDLAADEAAVRELAGQARALLEALYRQHLTFTGESGRPRTGIPLEQLEATARLQSFAGSGTGAVIAHTIRDQVATSGGVNVGGNVQGGVHTGEPRR